MAIEGTQSNAPPPSTEGVKELSGPEAGKNAVVAGQTKTGNSTNMETLRKEEPEFFKAMMMSMAQELCDKMKNWDERIKKARKDQERR